MPKKTFAAIPESKRQKVMDCALEEFSKYKYHDASINRIVRCAKIPRGSFYQYFEDKEDLFFHLFETILQGELEQFYQRRVEAMPKDPVLFHQITFSFNLYMLNNDKYRDFYRNLFLVMDYRFTRRYKEIVGKQRELAIANLGLQGSDTGKRMKEVLEICSLITMELLAMKVLEELSDEEIWKRYHARFRVLGWDSFE